MRRSATAPTPAESDLVVVALSAEVVLAVTAVAVSPAALVPLPATSAVVPTILLGTARRKP